MILFLADVVTFLLQPFIAFSVGGCVGLYIGYKVRKKFNNAKAPYLFAFLALFFAFVVASMLWHFRQEESYQIDSVDMLMKTTNFVLTYLVSLYGFVIFGTLYLFTSFYHLVYSNKILESAEKPAEPPPEPLPEHPKTAEEKLKEILDKNRGHTK